MDIASFVESKPHLISPRRACWKSVSYMTLQGRTKITIASMTKTSNQHPTPRSKQPFARFSTHIRPITNHQSPDKPPSTPSSSLASPPQNHRPIILSPTKKQQ
jgi:hypothetical protein